jgi:hypothetical protein
MCMCTFSVSLIHENNLYLTLSLSPVPTRVFHAVKVDVRGRAHPSARAFVCLSVCSHVCMSDVFRALWHQFQDEESLLLRSLTPSVNFILAGHPTYDHARIVCVCTHGQSW